jgi:hypothetical protein
LIRLARSTIGAFFASHSLLPQHASVAPMPSTAYRSNNFYAFVGNVFALIFVLSFFFPSFFLSATTRAPMICVIPSL